MLNEKNLTRVFFALALAVFAGAGAHRAVAQARIVDGGDCSDGDRKECLTQPVDGGGTMHFYWV